MDKTLGSVREPHTYEQMAAALGYDPITGELTWKVDRSQRVKAGMKAGSKHNAGYITLEFEGVPYLAHRVAWLLHHKKWPSHFIDHEDLDKANNRIQNLRSATRAGNSQNHPLRQDNSSGVKGVNWHAKSGKWSARIQVDKRRITLGYYERLEDAKVAVETARSQLHKEYARNGKSSFEAAVGYGRGLDKIEVPRDLECEGGWCPRHQPDWHSNWPEPQGVQKQICH